jgi:hypothetical protein
MVARKLVGHQLRWPILQAAAFFTASNLLTLYVTIPQAANNAIH